MLKAIVIGSPGAGKSTFARRLRNLTGLPLYYLDMLWHKPDQTNITREEFDTLSNDIIKKDSWIIDGNYQRTLAERLKACDTVFLMDYPLETCLSGAESRIGKKREDMPWVESEFDEELKQWIIDFPDKQLPQIYELLNKYRKEKEIIIFKSRKEADDYLRNASKKVSTGAPLSACSAGRFAAERQNKAYMLQQRHKAEPLFAGWDETLIWSCLQNVMGHIYVDNTDAPNSAMAMLGDFCFLAGKPDEELAAYKPDCCKQEFMIMIPQTDQWSGVIEKYYGEKAKKVVRYAFKKEKEVFNKAALEAAVAGLPADYRIEMIDESIFRQCSLFEWSRDLVSQYKEYPEYRDHGLGVVILKEDEIVSGASSYAGYIGGIEIEIDTKEEYRRQGLAYAAGAKLILECLERDWYPSWDAQNKGSAALAEKLGYHFVHAYSAYEIWGYGCNNGE